METTLYHMTHIDNLPGILQAGRIFCDRQAAAHQKRSVAYHSYKQCRRERVVPVEPGGMIADYVPFYFAPLSPMLYVIHIGRVDPSVRQSEIVYLTTTVRTIVQAQKPCVFSDRHPLRFSARFSNNIDQLDQYVDWSVMRSERWHDTPLQPNRKSLRQAEFLVHQAVEWTLVEQLGVYNDAMQQRVEAILQACDHRPPVVVKRNWYY
ncbi:MAG: DUF4433 domain-containing protein [Fimbriimonadales bacterium]